MSRLHAVFRLSRRAALAAALATALLASPNARAADWPNRGITIIVPFAAGGGSDLVARMMAPYLTEALKVPVIVENRGGAGGNIGIAAAKRAAPDGYTLMTVSSAFMVNPSLYERAGYEPLEDFIPLVNVGSAPDVLVVPASSKYKNFKEFFDDAKANPGKLNWAAPGVGTTPYMIVELIKHGLGFEMVHVPFVGAGPAAQAAVAGQLDMFSANIGSVLALIQGGQLRPIVQTGAERWPDLPDVPLLSDVGLPGVTSENHQSMYLPAGVPQEIVDRLAKELQAILARPEVQAQIYKTGLKVVNEGPAVFRARVQREVANYKTVIEKTGLKRIK